MVSVNQTEISFNYFYKMFIQKYNVKVIELSRKKLSIKDNDALSNLASISNIERLEIYKEVLFSICEEYLTLSKSNIEVIPCNVFELVNLILDNNFDNEYGNSFLTSLQFIYQSFFQTIGRGNPALWQTEVEEDEDNYLEVTVNKNKQIEKFDAYNMNLLEQDKIMTKILMMEIDGSLGPLPKVRIIQRNDI